MAAPKFSIIAPIYNELENLPVLYSRIKEVMGQTSDLCTQLWAPNCSYSWA